MRAIKTLLLFFSLHHLRHLPMHLRHAFLKSLHQSLVNLNFKSDFHSTLLLFRHPLSPPQPFKLVRQQIINYVDRLPCSHIQIHFDLIVELAKTLRVCFVTVD